jgi:FKBP-type peptidyl-prolyl cis-trans isomerase
MNISWGIMCRYKHQLSLITFMRTFGTREWIAVIVAVVAAAILFFGGSIWNFFFGVEEIVESLQAPAITSESAAKKTTMTNISTIQGLEIYDIQAGTGAEATKGKTVTAHYVGVLQDGTKFDSSLDRGQPFSFNLGAGQVIRGWDEGIAGMKVGGVRRLVIAPELGYGNQAIGSIPAGSTLVFEVQLLDVK